MKRDPLARVMVNASIDMAIAMALENQQNLRLIHCIKWLAPDAMSRCLFLRPNRHLSIYKNIPPILLPIIYGLLVTYTSLYCVDVFCEEAKSGRWVVRHAQHVQPYLARRESYFIQLLDLALLKSGSHYERQPVFSEPHSEMRTAKFLQHGVYDVQWLNTSIYLENILEPIRIPLFKGLIGWRVFIIRESDARLFSGIETLDELRILHALQGTTWPDTQILKENRFRIYTSTDFQTLSKMLARGRGDFYPRSIIEAWLELPEYSEYDFIIDQHIALVYPAAYYFFVRKESDELRTAIERGLVASIDDGTFDVLFWKNFKDEIMRSNLHKRHIFILQNPFLPSGTPLENHKLWFQMRDMEKLGL